MNPLSGHTASHSLSSAASSSSSSSHVFRYFFPDQYVGVGAIHVFIGTNGQQMKIPMVAVSIIDYRGRTILDTFVQPTHEVEDYRTPETGIVLTSLSLAPSFQEVQHRVATIIQDKIIVGHSLWSFLSIMGLSHPTIQTRDMGLFKPLRRQLNVPSIVELGTLMSFFMGRQIGLDYEDSIETSRACMDLFRSCEEHFESSVAAGRWPCDLPPASHRDYFT